MLVPGFGVVLLTKSNCVTVILFILITGSLTRKTVNIKIMITTAWISINAVMQPQHLMNFRRRIFFNCAATSSSSLLGRSAGGASGRACSFSAMAGSFVVGKLGGEGG
ncbi:hypothetical protein TorRG33x02_295300 [Trema orientale]|uniref:Uncharacterized protein n=1 Tax=Trema orientale TaxID=63057 RepID=A0A2P5C6V6_TREOI|nr:hypothetical protein TorRG33x02_295300 [Trema orientale]